MNRKLGYIVALSIVIAGIPLAVVGQPRQQQGGNRPAAAQRSARPVTIAAACVPGEVRTRLDECPSGAPRSQKGAGGAPRSRLQTSKRRAEAKKAGPTGPSIELDLAARRNREATQTRALQLLEREVRVLNRLVQNTRTNDPRRPDILLRLAETYFEFQQHYNTAARSLDQQIFEARQAKNANRFRQLRQQQQQAQQNLDRYRQEAIRTYATLVQDHPNYRRMDEVMFSLAFGLEEMRQFDRARQVYHRLIKGFPQSRFIPHAYLSFAEFYFNEGDMRAAIQFYSKVVEFPPDRNPVYGYALYKSAWANYNLEDFRGALTRFVEVLEFATQNPDARDATNLARQARRELVLPYSRVGTPARALEFFQRYARNQEEAYEMLESLAELYYDTGQWPETLQVYHKLMSEMPNSDKLCYWQSRVTNAVISSRPKAEQVTEVQRMIDMYELFTGQNHPAESEQQCKQETAGILVELATAWHREAIGTDEQPGTNDRRTMELASTLYRLVIEKFPDMEQMEFPNIDRRDWPTQYKVAYFYAELLWKMENWAQCGPAFDRVVELNPQGDYTADAAYAAVLCYNNLYQQQYSGRERTLREGGGARIDDGQGGAQTKRGRRGRRGQQQEAEAEAAPALAPRDFTPLEQGMLNAFQRYVCYVGESEDLPTIKYRRARIYYESNRFEEAAMIFKDIAWNHRETELAEYAANLYLDSMNVLGAVNQPARPACFDQMEEDLGPLEEMYCNTEDMRASHADLCGTIDRLKCGLLRKKAEAYQTNREFKRAAMTYVRIFRRFRNSADSCGGRMDEVLWNAALNFEAARLLGRAIQVRKALISAFPESEWSKRAVFLVGANYHALAIYSQAADYYEQFARRFPGEDGSRCTDAERTAGTCPIAHEALQNAVFFRLGLGETDTAIDDARLFERNYRTRLPRETSQVIFSLGTIYERARVWNKVVDHYRDFLRRYGRAAMPQQVIRANVEIGNAYWEVNDKTRAEPFYRAAAQAWERGAAERIAQIDVDDAKKALFLYEAKDAASEAYFHLAEYRFADVERVRWPEFRGDASLERVNQWAQRDFTAWIQRRTEAMRTAEEAYNRLAPLEIPQWQIAAASRIGQMYRSFVDLFRDAPIPEEIERDDELYGIYTGALDEQSEPLRRQAIEKFEFCLITSTRVRWFNDYSRTCEQELNQLNPGQYPLAAELRGNPNYVFSSPARPAAIELRTGTDEEVEDVGGGEVTGDTPAGGAAPAGGAQGGGR